MISNSPVTACLTVTDLEIAKKFYIEKLELKEVPTTHSQGILLEAGNATKIFIYTSGAPKATNTVASFIVSDVLTVVNELKAKGVEFESYDFEKLKTDEDNIATFEDTHSAWFKDPDGNILGISNH